jgi:hypothetical protein
MAPKTAKVATTVHRSARCRRTAKHNPHAIGQKQAERDMPRVTGLPGPEDLRHESGGLWRCPSFRWPGGRQRARRLRDIIGWQNLGKAVPKIRREPRLRRAASGFREDGASTLGAAAGNLGQRHKPPKASVVRNPAASPRPAGQVIVRPSSHLYVAKLLSTANRVVRFMEALPTTGC